MYLCTERGYATQATVYTYKLALMEIITFTFYLVANRFSQLILHTHKDKVRGNCKCPFICLHQRHTEDGIQRALEHIEGREWRTFVLLQSEEEDMIYKELRVWRRQPVSGQIILSSE